MFLSLNRSGRVAALVFSACLIAAACATGGAVSRSGSAAGTAAQIPEAPCAGDEPALRDLESLVGGNGPPANARFRIDCAGSTRAAGSHVIEGRLVPLAGGESLAFRGVWTRRPDGSVMKEFLRLDADSGVWQTFFVGISRRRMP